MDEEKRIAEIYRKSYEYGEAYEYGRRAGLAARDAEVARLRGLLAEVPYMDYDWDEVNGPDGFEFDYGEWVEWRIKVHAALANPTQADE